MAYEPAGMERRIKLVEIRSVIPGKYSVIGYGPGRTRVHVERMVDAVKGHGGIEFTISGFKQVIEIEPVLDNIILRREVVPESGAVIIHINGG